MKNVKGGSEDDNSCGCTCSGPTPGQWYYANSAQPSNTYLHNDVKNECGGEGLGSCTNCTNWVE